MIAARGTAERLYFQCWASHDAGTVLCRCYQTLAQNQSSLVAYPVPVSPCSLEHIFCLEDVRVPGPGLWEEVLRSVRLGMGASWGLGTFPGSLPRGHACPLEASLSLDTGATLSAGGSEPLGPRKPGPSSVGAEQGAAVPGGGLSAAVLVMLAPPSRPRIAPELCGSDRGCQLCLRLDAVPSDTKG